ncbi:MAG: hypothetical protein JEZ06_18350 [Anaerolineaceae bacterium]|nr:hypothetical protein [Anaerolineaceae bacterium]
MLITDEHSEAFVYIFEDGGTTIKLPEDHEISMDENGNTILILPGCN